MNGAKRKSGRKTHGSKPQRQQAEHGPRTAQTTIENMNGLLRQYIPKKTDFKGISNTMVAKVMEKLNNRPRKKNGFMKPKDMIKKQSA